MIDALVDRRRILAKSSLDVIAQIEGDRIVQIDGAMLAHPLTDVGLLAVICPRQRRGVERIVPVAHVGALRHETLDHGEIACPAARCSAVPLLTPIMFQLPSFSRRKSTASCCSRT